MTDPFLMFTTEASMTLGVSPMSSNVLGVGSGVSGISGGLCRFCDLLLLARGDARALCTAAAVQLTLAPSSASCEASASPMPVSRTSTRRGRGAEEGMLVECSGIWSSRDKLGRKLNVPAPEDADICESSSMNIDESTPEDSPMLGIVAMDSPRTCRSSAFLFFLVSSITLYFFRLGTSVSTLSSDSSGSASFSFSTESWAKKLFRSCSLFFSGWLPSSSLMSSSSFPKLVACRPATDAAPSCGPIAVFVAERTYCFFLAVCSGASSSSSSS
mmetsp:Transcript_75072/g.132717  ORF Transcript_75072/g.132717 Transcript_75072/m.132717 type:complete len:272 (-) Transcript_75072:252-1067(-)